MMSLPDPPISDDVDLRELFPYMPLKVSQLLNSDTWTLATGDEAKACLTLWCYAWHQVPAGSIPNNDKILAVRSGAGDNWTRVKDVVLRGFVECSDGRLYHARIVEKALEAWSKRKLQSRGGKNGAAKRWGNKRKTRNGLLNGLANGIAVANPMPSQWHRREEKIIEEETLTSDRVSPETTESQTHSRCIVREVDVEEFWKAYPHRGIYADPKKPAIDKFKAKVKSGVDPGEIIAAAKRYRDMVAANRTDPKFVPQAVKWLKDERWRDEYQPIARSISPGFL